MIVTDLKSLAQVRAFNNIGGLALNTNGYPYVTLLFSEKDKKTKACNLYFANAAKKDEQGNEIAGTGFADTVKQVFDLKQGEPVNVSAMDLMAFLRDNECTVAQVLNNKNEMRFKLARKGGTKYLSKSTFAEMFDLEITEESMDFDVDAFRKEFRAKDEIVEEQPQINVKSVEDQLDELYELFAATPTKLAKNRVLKQIQLLDPTATFENVSELVTG